MRQRRFTRCWRLHWRLGLLIGRLRGGWWWLLALARALHLLKRRVDEGHICLNCARPVLHVAQLLERLVEALEGGEPLARLRVEALRLLLQLARLGPSCCWLCHTVATPMLTVSIAAVVAAPTLSMASFLSRSAKRRRRVQAQQGACASC